MRRNQSVELAYYGTMKGRSHDGTVLKARLKILVRFSKLGKKYIYAPSKRYITLLKLLACALQS